MDGFFERPGPALWQAVQMANARTERITAAWSQQGTPGKSGPAVFAFLCPKPPLGSFTKAIGLGSSMPSWRSGNTHGFCVTGGHSPIASEPTPSRRLWAAAPGATPALRIEHTTGGRSGHSKPELSTLLESGTFYFALTFWGIMALERSCKAGAGLSILIQHLKIGSPTRFGAGEQAPGGSPQGRSLKALGGHPPRFTNVGQCRGPVRPSGALPSPGPPPFRAAEISH
jgi:hypothetical protein